MTNQTMFILSAAVIAVCALIFFAKVKVNFNKQGVSVEGSEEKKVAVIKGSKRVDVTQKGSAETTIEDSEDIKVNND
jgi:hypothetical protein